MRVEVLVAGQRSCRRVPARVELVEVPAEPVDVPGAVADQVFSVIDEQAELPGGAIELGRRAGPVRAAPPGRPRARRSGRTCRRSAPSPGHGPSASAAPARSAHRRRAGPPPDAATDVGSPPPPTPARRRTARPNATARGEQPSWSSSSWSSTRARRPALVDGDHGVGALVRVDPEDHHVLVAFHDRGGDKGPVGGHTSVGAMPRSYQATPAGPACPRGGTHDVTATNGSNVSSQAPGQRPA